MIKVRYSVHVHVYSYCHDIHVVDSSIWLKYFILIYQTFRPLHVHVVVIFSVCASTCTIINSITDSISKMKAFQFD